MTPKQKRDKESINCTILSMVICGITMAAYTRSGYAGICLTFFMFYCLILRFPSGEWK